MEEEIQLPPKPPKTRRFVMGVIVLAVVIALAVFGYRFFSEKKAAPTGRPAVPVRVAEAVKGAFPVLYSSLGTVTALNTATVRSRVDGELVSLHFTEGQKVEAGDLLASVDPRPFQAQVEQAQGQLLRDQASLTNAQQNLVRAEQLLPEDSISKQDVDSARAQVKLYEGAVRLDKGQLDSAKLQLTYSRIAAPISGLTGLRMVDVGNMIRSGDATANGIVVITQVQPINVIFTVTEAQLPAVLEAMRQNPALPVEAWDRTKKNLLAQGKVISIDNQVNTSTGTVRVKAEFTNEDDRLFPNLFVNAKIQVSVLEEVCIVPTAAVQLGNQGSFVYVVGADNRVALRQVEVGPANDDNTVINKGVEPGEKVVIDGLDQLRDKSPVTIATEQDRNGKGGAPDKKAAKPEEGALQGKEGSQPAAQPKEAVKPEEGVAQGNAGSPPATQGKEAAKPDEAAQKGNPDSKDGK